MEKPEVGGYVGAGLNETQKLVKQISEVKKELGKLDEKIEATSGKLDRTILETGRKLDDLKGQSNSAELEGIKDNLSSIQTELRNVKTTAESAKKTANEAKNKSGGMAVSSSSLDTKRVAELESRVNKVEGKINGGVSYEEYNKLVARVVALENERANSTVKKSAPSFDYSDGFLGFIKLLFVLAPLVLNVIVLWNSRQPIPENEVRPILPIIILEVGYFISLIVWTTWLNNSYTDHNVWESVMEWIYGISTIISVFVLYQSPTSDPSVLVLCIIPITVISGAMAVFRIMQYIDDVGSPDYDIDEAAKAICIIETIPLVIIAGLLIIALCANNCNGC